MFMIYLLFWSGVLFLVVGSLYYASAIVGGYFNVKSKPREEMMWCPQKDTDGSLHGHFRKSYCLPMAGTLVCPRCYLNAIKQADKVELWRK